MEYEEYWEREWRLVVGLALKYYRATLSSGHRILLVQQSGVECPVLHTSIENKPD